MGMGTLFIDSLYLNSAVLRHGMVVVDTANHYSSFGEIVFLCLIQIGGLGFMTFATLIAMILGRKISLRERIILQESLNQLSLQGVVRLVKHVLIFSFTIEGLGALILFIRWLPEMGWGKSVYYAAFHSVSAFNNAGFDLMGNFPVSRDIGAILLSTLWSWGLSFWAVLVLQYLQTYIPGKRKNSACIPVWFYKLQQFLLLLAFWSYLS
jgi:hypothetical protein